MLDASTGGIDLPVNLTNMSSNSRNLKSPFLTPRCLYQWSGWSASWSANISSNSRNLKLPSLTTRYLYWGGRSASWDATNMTSNSWNLKSPFLTIRCLYWRGRSASWLANMSSNNRNVKSPFLTAKCLYWGFFLPVNRPLWALTVEISIDHSWTLDASTGGRSASWDANIWPLTLEISKWPFLTTRCLCLWGRSANWSANICSNIRNLKSPFLTTRCLYWRGRSASWSGKY